MRLPVFVHNLLSFRARTSPNLRRLQIVGASSYVQEDGRFGFVVTLHAGRDMPCDCLDVLAPDGRVLSTKSLAEHSATQAELTHELTDVAVESTIKYVFVRARRRERGYDGQRFKVELPAR
jgi:hypothetical protein